MNDLNTTIYNGLKGVKVIDTHEHLWDEKWRLVNPGDWTSLFQHYCDTVLRSAGMSELEGTELYSLKTPHDRKWEIFSKYYPLVRQTAYIQAVCIAIRDIYGIVNVDSASMAELTRKIQEKVKPGFHRKILQDMAGIDYCMVNCFDVGENGSRIAARFNGDTDLLRPDIFGDCFIYFWDKDAVEKKTGVDCGSLRGWEKAIGVYFAAHAKESCAVKIALAYMGALNFRSNISRNEVENMFLEHSKSHLPYDDVRPLVDYLVHCVIKEAVKHNLPLKFHTGIYSGPDCANFYAQADNVKHLAQLAIANPNAKIIAMHIAYPYHTELVMAIKQITNLYADMCWSWIVDPNASVQFLKSAIVAAPISKVMGFGGDYALVENVYGHLEIARKTMSGALADFVESGYMNVEEAIEIGMYLLRGSSELLYKK